MSKIIFSGVIGIIVGIVSFLVVFSFFHRGKTTTISPAPVPTVSVTLTVTPNASQSSTISALPVLKPDKKATSSSFRNNFGAGQLCGGLGKIPCPPEFTCIVDPNNIDSSGFCQKP